MADQESPFRPGGPLRNGHPETPEERDLRERAEAFRQRAQDAIEEAKMAFWAKIAASFPEVTHGDFSPEATVKWDNVVEESVYVWLKWNFPGAEELLAKIAEM